MPTLVTFVTSFIVVACNRGRTYCYACFHCSLTMVQINHLNLVTPEKAVCELNLSLCVIFVEAYE